MKKYDIFVQDIFYKRITTKYITDIIRSVAIDVSNDLIPNFDHSKPASIKIVPVT